MLRMKMSIKKAANRRQKPAYSRAWALVTCSILVLPGLMPYYTTYKKRGCEWLTAKHDCSESPLIVIPSKAVIRVFDDGWGGIPSWEEGEGVGFSDWVPSIF